MLLDLKKEITYGPVNSRRLGRSLGINLLPAGIKVCSFNCLYCQYGWTDLAWQNQLVAPTLPSVDEVAESVLGALSHLPTPPAYITFSGHGEATLHPRFGEIVDRVIEIRDAVAPISKTAILSNSSTVGKSEIRASLARLDFRIMKLDAGSDACLVRFNQPIPGMTIAGIAKGLCQLDHVTIQSLFAAGSKGNMGDEDITSWLDRVSMIHPDLVQIYTLTRGYPSVDIEPATRSHLQRIHAALENRGIAATVYEGGSAK